MLGPGGAREFVNDWVKPAWLWPWNYKTEEISKVAMLAFVAQQDKRWVEPRMGIGGLVCTLASLLDVQVNTTVRRISAADSNGRHTVHFLTANGQRRSVTPDVVVCATEGVFVLPMVQGLGDREKNYFKQVHLNQYAAVTYLLKEGYGPTAPISGIHLTNSHPDAAKRKIGLVRSAA